MAEMSRKSIEALREFGEVNLFLRGVIPQLGFKTSAVPYDRNPRFAGESKYPFRKMAALAIEGVTSFSIKPLRLITLTGFVLFVLSIIVAVWAFSAHVLGYAHLPGWTSILMLTSLIGGMQLFSLGVLGEYLGKIYLETKRCPRFIVDRFEGDAFAGRQASPETAPLDLELR